MEPLSEKTLHIVVDMQAIFAEETAWYTPALLDILPRVLELTQARLDQTVFARFMTPSHPDQAQGQWRELYRHQVSVTTLHPRFLDLVEPLYRLASPHTVIDKSTYSVFGAQALEARLAAADIDTIVFTGVETDVCVLASIFDAVDRGFRVVVPADAVASSSIDGHSAVLDHVLPRLSQQIHVSDVQSVLSSWTT